MGIRLGSHADDRPLHPARDRGRLDRRGALRRDARRGGGRRRGAGRPDRRRNSTRSAPRPSRSRRSTSARRSSTTTRRRSSTCWRRAPGPAGRWIHYGLTSSDVVDTGLALQLKRAGRAARPRRAHACARTGREGARARGDAVRRPHPRRPRRADLVRPQARGLRDGDAPQRGAAGTRFRADHGRDLRRRRHASRRSGPTTRSASLRTARADATRTSPRRSSRATATPSC